MKEKLTAVAGTKPVCQNLNHAINIIAYRALETAIAALAELPPDFAKRR